MRRSPVAGLRLAFYTIHMKLLLLVLASACALLAGQPAVAHPHIFVETGLRLVPNASGEIVGVDVTWRYDELYSLLVLEDMELDADFDGTLTEQERRALEGFDLNWIEGFEGDLYAAASGSKVTLGPPEGRGTRLAGGQIVSRHFRAFDAPRTRVSLKAYDPTYYTAYDLGIGVDLPEDCEAEIRKADVNAASRMVQNMMGDEIDDPEADFPEVGEAFADEIVVTCAAGS